MYRCVLKSLKKQADGKLLISWTSSESNETFSDTFDTALWAMGRHALTKDLQLENAGVKVAESNGKIACVNEQTNIPHIFAVGDVLYVRLSILLKFNSIKYDYF